MDYAMGVAGQPPEHVTRQPTHVMTREPRPNPHQTAIPISTQRESINSRVSRHGDQPALNVRDGDAGKELL